MNTLLRDAVGLRTLEFYTAAPSPVLVSQLNLDTLLMKQ